MSANENQVGGSHYKTPHQHWDLAADLGLGYFEGQITKYVTRHRSKKGLEDLQKALHFTIKLTELVKTGRYLPGPGMADRLFAWLIPVTERSPAVRLDLDTLWEYAAANSLTDPEAFCIEQVCNWRTVSDLYVARARIEDLIFDTYGPR